MHYWHLLLLVILSLLQPIFCKHNFIDGRECCSSSSSFTEERNNLLRKTHLNENREILSKNHDETRGVQSTLASFSDERSLKSRIYLKAPDDSRRNILIERTSKEDNRNARNLRGPLYAGLKREDREQIGVSLEEYLQNRQVRQNDLKSRDLISTRERQYTQSRNIPCERHLQQIEGQNKIIKTNERIEPRQNDGNFEIRQNIRDFGELNTHGARNNMIRFFEERKNNFGNRFNDIRSNEIYERTIFDDHDKRYSIKRVNVRSVRNRVERNTRSEDEPIDTRDYGSYTRHNSRRALYSEVRRTDARRATDRFRAYIQDEQITNARYGRSSIKNNEDNSRRIIRYRSIFTERDSNQLSTRRFKDDSATLKQEEQDKRARDEGPNNNRMSYAKNNLNPSRKAYARKEEKIIMSQKTHDNTLKSLERQARRYRLAEIHDACKRDPSVERESHISRDYENKNKYVRDENNSWGRYIHRKSISAQRFVRYASVRRVTDDSTVLREKSKSSENNLRIRDTDRVRSHFVRRHDHRNSNMSDVRNSGKYYTNIINERYFSDNRNIIAVKRNRAREERVDNRKHLNKRYSRYRESSNMVVTASQPASQLRQLYQNDFLSSVQKNRLKRNDNERDFRSILENHVKYLRVNEDMLPLKSGLMHQGASIVTVTHATRSHDYLGSNRYERETNADIRVRAHFSKDNIHKKIGFADHHVEKLNKRILSNANDIRRFDEQNRVLRYVNSRNDERYERIYTNKRNKRYIASRDERKTSTRNIPINIWGDLMDSRVNIRERVVSLVPERGAQISSRRSSNGNVRHILNRNSFERKYGHLRDNTRSVFLLRSRDSNKQNYERRTKARNDIRLNKIYRTADSYEGNERKLDVNNEIFIISNYERYSRNRHENPVLQPDERQVVTNSNLPKRDMHKDERLMTRADSKKNLAGFGYTSRTIASVLDKHRDINIVRFINKNSLRSKEFVSSTKSSEESPMLYSQYIFYALQGLYIVGIFMQGRAKSRSMEWTAPSRLLKIE